MLMLEELANKDEQQGRINFSTVEIMKNKPTSTSLADCSVTNISVVDCEKITLVEEKAKAIHECYRHQKNHLFLYRDDIKLPVCHLRLLSLYKNSARQRGGSLAAPTSSKFHWQG